ncbi:MULTISPECIES: hypothetical protein [unclassified Nocardiopsis]|uniref:hypothetical protein n=1 Tax=unclassified Nocardiopsis TaxID=2649073 RepID=UPI000AD07FC9|nr:hypothetical protein [Nocardiopsis sp. TSRI0078]
MIAQRVQAATAVLAHMEALRLMGGELADATVDALFARGEAGKFNTLMRYFSTAGQDLPDGLPDVAREYLHATATPPAWVDWGEMERARLFSIDAKVHISAHRADRWTPPPLTLRT